MRSRGAAPSSPRLGRRAPSARAISRNASRSWLLSSTLSSPPRRGSSATGSGGIAPGRIGTTLAAAGGAAGRNTTISALRSAGGVGRTGAAGGGGATSCGGLERRFGSRLRPAAARPGRRRAARSARSAPPDRRTVRIRASRRSGGRDRIPARRTSARRERLPLRPSSSAARRRCGAPPARRRACRRDRNRRGRGTPPAFRRLAARGRRKRPRAPDRSR